MKADKRPPAWADRFLELLISDDKLEMLQGDLHELFRERLTTHSLWYARSMYLIDALGLLRPFALKSFIPSSVTNPMIMFENYLKTGWRNIVREKWFTVINLISLSLAITGLSIIFLYLNSELSFDKFHTNSENIFRMVRQPLSEGQQFNEDINMPEPLAKALENDFASIENTVRMYPDNQLLRNGQDFFRAEVLLSDPSLFDIFDFPLLAGDYTALIKDPSQVIISREFANRIFGNGVDVLNRTIELRQAGDFKSFTVAGVAADPPRNSTIQFDIVVPLQNLLQTDFGMETIDSWNDAYLLTFIQLRAACDQQGLLDQMPEFWMRHRATAMEIMLENGSWDDPARPPAIYAPQPLRELHSSVNFGTRMVPPVDPWKYWVLSAMALFILLLGCINFTLLTIGKATRRAAEIGVRKTFGARRSQLAMQFWSESALTGLLALSMALLFLYITLPRVNYLLQTDLEIHQVFAPEVLLVLLVIAAGTGILAGIYPSIILSGFDPVRIFRERNSGGHSSFFSKSLIVIQFAVSAFFLFGAFVMNDQINFMKQKDPGISRDGVVVLSTQQLPDQDIRTFQKELEQESFVNAVSAIRFTLPIYANAGWFYNEEYFRANVLAADRNFIEAFGLELTAGRGFYAEEPDSVSAFVVNEAFMDMMGYEQLDGQTIPGYNRRGVQEPVIIGVVKNFHFQSLENEIQPMIITINPNEPFSNLMIRMRAGEVSRNLDLTKDLWRDHFPEQAFEFSFLSDDLEAEYAGQERWNSTFRFAGLINIFIACLGLFGFSTLFVTGRIREIGIRKVMGASSLRIFTRFCIQFFSLIIVACLIAGMAGYLVLSRWLQEFAYNISISLTHFLLMTCVVFILAALAIAYQFIKTREVNPAVILREG